MGRRNRPAYLHLEVSFCKRIKASTLLSPFDPLIWHRLRVERLFDFEYRFEIFVLTEKRRWGCYVLAFLQGQWLSARVHLKTDRQGRCLLVLAAYKEPKAPPGPTAAALTDERRTLASRLELELGDRESESGLIPLRGFP
jgi:uncharacterized protein